MKLTEKISDNTAIITLEEDLSINNTENNQIETIKKTVNENNNIRIVLKNVEDIDLTVIQLLYSIKKTCEKEDKKLEFDIKLPQKLDTLLKNTGFDKQIIN